MLLVYETSSISYDQVDLIYGKFVPAKPHNFTNKECSCYSPQHSSIRFIINIYGVFADMTGMFARRYDDLKIPHSASGIYDPEYIKNNIPKSGIEAILEEDGFWSEMEAYPWYMLLMSELYPLCDGDFYLGMPHFDGVQADHRWRWIFEHFGDSEDIKLRTLMIHRKTAATLCIRSRSDIIIASSLEGVERWSDMGGSGFWWPEIDINYKDAPSILAKRISLLSKSIKSLKQLNAERISLMKNRA